MHEIIDGIELQSHLGEAGSDQVQDSFSRLSDDRDLIRLAKKPVLKRSFGDISIRGF